MTDRVSSVQLDRKGRKKGSETAHLEATTRCLKHVSTWKHPSTIASNRKELQSDSLPTFPSSSSYQVTLGWLRRKERDELSHWDRSFFHAAIRHRCALHSTDFDGSFSASHAVALPIAIKIGDDEYSNERAAFCW